MDGKRRLIECKAPDFLRQYLHDRREVMENSQAKVLARIMEQLAQSDPQIKAILERAHAVRAKAEPLFIKPRALPPLLHREDIPTIALSEEEALKGFLPRLSTLRVYLDPNILLNKDPLALVKSCVLPSTLNINYPRWATPFESAPEHSFWFGWRAHASSEVWSVAGVSGTGVSEDDQVTNTATWAWDFTAIATETVDIWFQHSVRGPCVWRTDGGDVSLWILFEVYVDKWVPPPTGSGPMTAQEVASIPYHINKLYSTNASLALDGPPPQPYFVPGCADCIVPLNPRDNHIQVQLEAGFAYTVYSGMTVALTANEHAAIGIGSWGGSSLHPAKFRGLCMICRCT